MDREIVNVLCALSNCTACHCDTTNIKYCGAGYACFDHLPYNSKWCVV